MERATVYGDLSEEGITMTSTPGDVMRLAKEYMSDRAREFIENWEVESYREKVAS